jgi:hypothetical protein
MLTVVMSGLISLQLANEPGVPYSAGCFSSLTAAAVDMYLTTTELVFARPAAGWRRDRPGGGRALRSGQPGPRAPAVEEPPVVTAYEPHRRYAVSPTELSPERWSGRTRSSRTARARF